MIIKLQKLCRASQRGWLRLLNWVMLNFKIKMNLSAAAQQQSTAERKACHVKKDKAGQAPPGVDLKGLKI